MSDSIDQDMFKATVMSAADELISGIGTGFLVLPFADQDRKHRLDRSVGWRRSDTVPAGISAVEDKYPLELANPLRNIDYDPELFQFVQPERSRRC